LASEDVFTSIIELYSSLKIIIKANVLPPKRATDQDITYGAGIATLPEHLSSLPVLNEIRDARSLVSD
jgi:hypothetical protein